MTIEAVADTLSVRASLKVRAALVERMIQQGKFPHAYRTTAGKWRIPSGMAVPFAEHRRFPPRKQPPSRPLAGRFLSTTEVAEWTNQHPSTVLRRCKQGWYPNAKQTNDGKGSHWRVPESDLEQLVSVPMAARMLGLSAYQIRVRCEDGKVPGCQQRAGRHWRIPISWVIQMARGTQQNI